MVDICCYVPREETLTANKNLAAGPKGRPTHCYHEGFRQNSVALRYSFLSNVLFSVILVLFLAYTCVHCGENTLFHVMHFLWEITNIFIRRI